MVCGTAFVQNFDRLSRAPVLFDETEYTNMGWRYVHWGSLTGAARASAVNNFEHPPLAKLLFGLAEEVAGSPSIPAARAVGAVCTVVAAGLLGWWLARVADRWTGLLGGGMLALVPMTVFPQVTGFGRTAMLDPVAEVFMLVSVVCGWFWFSSSGRRSWGLAVATGVAAGLSAASKENGVLGIVAPVALGLLWSRPPAPGLRNRAPQVAVAVVSSGAVFLCSYLPFGDPLGRIAYLYSFQSRHSRQGHAVDLAGAVTRHPPWWANLYFARQGMGWELAALVAATAVVALVLRRDRVVAWCAAALVVPFVFHAFLADVVLPFYWVLWMPMVLALSALGITQLWTAAVRADVRWRAAAAGLAASAALLGIAVPAVEQTVAVARLQPVGAAAVAGIRARLGLHGLLLVTRIPLPEVSPFLPVSRIMLRLPLPTRLDRVDTVVIGQPRCRIPLDSGIRALTEINLEIRSLRLVRTDRLLRMYIVVGRLHAPTPAEIRAQAEAPVPAGC